MTAKKNTAKTAKKSTSAKKAKPKTVKKPTQKKSDKGSALYVLIIMCLLALIALSAERFYDNIFKPSKESPSVTETADRDTFHESDEVTDRHIEDSPLEDEPVKPELVSEQKTVRVYLITYDEKTGGVALAPVPRVVDSKNYLEDTISHLLEGPTSDEKKRGYLTAIDRNAAVRSATVSNRIAVIDFNAAIESGGGGELLLNRIDQIVYTATQFDEIDAVRIKIDGRFKNTFGSDGISISSPLMRN